MISKAMALLSSFVLETPFSYFQNAITMLTSQISTSMNAIIAQELDPVSNKMDKREEICQKQNIKAKRHKPGNFSIANGNYKYCFLNYFVCISSK